MLNFREFCELSDKVKSLNENAEWDNSYVEVGRKVINPYLNPTKFGKIDLIDGQTVKLGLSPYYDREGKKQYAKIIKIPIRPKKEKMREGLMGEIKTIRQFEEIQNTSKENIQKFNDIKVQIQKRELFINPKINLRLLSEELELKEKELSRLINIHEKMNFYQFINEFRIEKFKKLIQSPDSQKYSIMGLAKKAGFNSKSTFYTAFKSIEGTTPSQYQKEINKS